MSALPPKIELEVGFGSTPAPGTEGYFLAWLHASDRPVVLWWSRLQTDWRDGGRVVQVTAWAGPLPARKRA